MKSLLSRSIRSFREGVKLFGAHVAAKTCRSKSFPLFGIPAGQTSGLEEGEGVKHNLYPAVSFPLKPPQTIDEKIFWRFEAILKGMTLPEQGILTLSNAIATSKGGNLTSKGKLIVTYLQPIDGKPPHKNDLFRFSTKKFLPRIYTTHEPVITLAAGWQGAFYHWVYEVLPRLHLVEQGEKILAKIYVEAAFKFQKECLELLDISSERMINAHDYAAVRTPHLIIPSIPEIPTEWACQFLRQKFLPKLSQLQPLRLYISRNDASRRRILNESAVIECLKKYGFEKVELSQKSFKEQAALFQAAEVVVGPHGAGFSHLVFCKPKTPFLEIFSPAYFHPCYWYVCNRVGLSYHYLLGEGERYPDFFETHQDPDIVVDIEKLKASLKLLGI